MASSLSGGITLARAQHSIEGETGEITLVDGKTVSFKNGPNNNGIVTEFPQAGDEEQCMNLWNNLTDGERAGRTSLKKLVVTYDSACVNTMSEKQFTYTSSTGQTNIL